MVDRPEKMELRPRLRFERTISSKRAIFESLDLGLVLSRSLMNSLNPKFGALDIIIQPKDNTDSYLAFAAGQQCTRHAHVEGSS